MRVMTSQYEISGKKHNRARIWRPLSRNDLISVQLYSTTNDPQPQMIPRPQMIPKMDRKRSSTASDTQSRPQMIPKERQEWLGLKLANHLVDFFIITKSHIKSEILLLK